MFRNQCHDATRDAWARGAAWTFANAWGLESTGRFGGGDVMNRHLAESTDIPQTAEPLPSPQTKKIEKCGKKLKNDLLES
ncbi:hypothetical protein TBK1r_16500 [Stieleria magnilauensis]|uniref:Uncharacterized protein n=1 Tax=Stieleria magnilauensis TaxID=2527963 RepID=A0ABX5XL57_9BACT|nr:hypothetical protein TBK1r_16500 [Planctomycetes bacterium TBK1r]